MPLPKVDDIYRLRRGDQDVFAKVTAVEEHGGHHRVVFSLWDKKDPGWQEGAALTQKFFSQAYGDEPVTGWDNDSVDPEYHDLDCSCIFCIPGA